MEEKDKITLIGFAVIIAGAILYGMSDYHVNYIATVMFVITTFGSAYLIKYCQRLLDEPKKKK